MNHVSIFTKPTCPYCYRAKALLDSLGVQYEEIDVLDFPERRQKEVINLYGHQTVPAIFIGKTFVGGNDALQKLNEEGKLVDMLGV